MSETTQHSFLNKIVDSLLQQDKPLHAYTFILPGKRPAVFIKKILAEKQYEGILPKFQTIDELITEISGLQQISGIPLWLFAAPCGSKRRIATAFGLSLRRGRGA